MRAFRPTSQLHCAATSIAATIAEGKGRSTPRDDAYFLGIARSSLLGTDTFIELAWRIGYIPDADVRAALALSDEIRRMLTALRNRIMEEGRNGRKTTTNPSNLEHLTSNLEE